MRIDPRPDRRAVLCGAGAAAATVALSGCAIATPTFSAETLSETWPPIGTFIGVSKGLTIHAWDEGAGDGPPVVLIHGASGNLRDWTFDIAPRLARTRRTIAIDRPGFGYSTRPLAQHRQKDWTPAAQAKALAAAMDEIGAARPILVGHSYGAAVAMAWALERPDDVAGVVAVSGVTMPYRGFARVFAALGLDRLAVSLYSRHLRRTGEEGGIDRFITRVFRPQKPRPGYIDYVGGPLALREATLEANKADLIGVNRELRRMAPNYPTLRPPLEIVHGLADFIDADKQSEKLAEAVPGANLTLLPGIGHMAHHSAPDALTAAIDRVAARAAAG